MIEITIRDGLGARITTLANAMSTGQEVAFGWDSNEHLPLPHEVVFPRGIAGVSFVPPMGDGGFTDWNAKPYFSWDGAAERAAANTAYATILAAMAGVAERPCKVGICARFFRNPHALPLPLAVAAVKAAHRVGAREVFLLADSCRWALRCHLSEHGIETRYPAAFPLTSDLARDEEDTLAFLGDWKTLLACQTIVAINGPSCLLNPARAAGRNIIYA
ncbi:MAG: hypothetical protein WCK77_21835 [Verrucomicrobiota bacterium]